MIVHKFFSSPSLSREPQGPTQLIYGDEDDGYFILVRACENYWKVPVEYGVALFEGPFERIDNTVAEKLQLHDAQLAEAVWSDCYRPYVPGQPCRPWI